MSSFIDSLLGSTSSSQTQVPQWLQTNLQNVDQRAWENAAQPYEPYTGQLTAGLNPYQQQGLNGLNGVASASIPYVNEGSAQARAGFNTTAGAGQYYQQGAAGLAGAQPYFQQGASSIAGAQPYFQQSAAGLAGAQPYFQQGASTLAGAQPYFQQASSMANASAGNIDPTQYLSPYQQQVIDATMAQSAHQFGITSNQAVGQAIRSGNAFGGDRMGVAQAELAAGQQRNDNSLLAGLNNQNWSQALATAQAQHGFEGQAANTLGGLGNSQVNAAQGYNQLGNSQVNAAQGYNQIGNSQVQAGLGYGQLGAGLSNNALGYGQIGNGVVNQGQTMAGQGVSQAGIGSQYQNNSLAAYNAQLTGGTQAQATEQAGLNAAYGQYQNRVAFPYQQTSFLANTINGGAGAAGSSTNSTSTPSIFSQLARGGVVHRASGGPISYDSFAGGPLDLNGTPGGEGLIPATQIQRATITSAPAPNPNSSGGVAPSTFMGRLNKGIDTGKQAVNFFNGLGAAAPGGVAGAVGGSSIGGAPLVAPTAANATLGAAGDAAAGLAGGVGEAGTALLALLSTGGVVPRRAQGGSVQYLFPDNGTPMGVGSIPGGRGLVPTISIARAALMKGSSPTPPSGKSDGNAVDKAKQVQTTIGDAAKWFTPKPEISYYGAKTVDDPTGGSSLYARGGLVPRGYDHARGGFVANPHEVARGAPMEFNHAPHNPGSGRPASIGTVGMYARGGLVPGYADGGEVDSGAGVLESIARSMSGGRGMAQRALYNATRNGIYTSETAPAAGGHSNALFSDLNTRRERDGYEAQRISRAVRGYDNGGIVDDDTRGDGLALLRDAMLSNNGAGVIPSDTSVPIPRERPKDLGADLDENGKPYSYDLRSSVHDNPDFMPRGLVPKTPAVEAIYKQAGIPIEQEDNAGLSPSVLSYDPPQRNAGGLRPSSPMQIAPQQGGLGQAGLAPPQSRPNTGNAPAPGLLGRAGMTEDGANALLQGLAGFLSASGGNGGLGVGLGRAITGATGSMANADAQRQAQAQADFENQMKVEKLNREAEAARLSAANQPVGANGTMNEPYMKAQERLINLREKDPEIVRQLEAAGYKKGTAEFREQIKRSIKGTSEPNMWQENPDGSVSPKPGGEKDPDYQKRVAEAKRLPGMSDEALGQMVQSYRVGNTGVLTGVGRGTQGADNLNRFWNIMSQQLKEEGLSGKDLAAAKANFSAQSAAARTAAVRETNVANAVEEAKGTFPIALQRSEELPRGSFVPLNRAIQEVQKGTSSPELARFVTANQAVITAYSQAMSRTGVNTVHAQQHAEALLSTATSQTAYRAVIDQMKQEMDMALTAPETVKKRILGGISGHKEEEPKSSSAAPSNATSQPASVPMPAQRKVGTVYQTPRGPMTWMGNGWQQ